MFEEVVSRSVPAFRLAHHAPLDGFCCCRAAERRGWCRIFGRRAAGETLAEIAKSYAVDISMVSRAVGAPAEAL